MHKNIFIFIICSIMPLMASRQSNLQISADFPFPDSLKPNAPPLPGKNVNVPDVPSVEVSPTLTDSLVSYPKVVNPLDIPSNIIQDTVTREAPKHIPPGGEEQLEQLKSKELPVTNDSGVTRVKPSDK